jgi:hypothetical protein
MDRDMELVKEILKELRDGNYGLDSLGGPDDEAVIYHLKIMAENDLVDVELIEIASRDSGIKKEWAIGRIGGLTWEGHEFLDAAENTTAWAKATDFLREQGRSVPFAVLKPLLVETIKAQAGI